MSVHHQPNLEEINKHITDRTNVFYWQAERTIEPADAGYIWTDRHRYFTDDEIIAKVNQNLQGEEMVSLVPLDLNAQTNLGSINSVRVGILSSGKEVIIRCHPKGVKNGYFHSEAVAAQRAKDAGLPSFSTITIHEYEGGDDFAFHVIEKLPGTALKKWLEIHPEDEKSLLVEVGKTMAKLHQISVDGFGPLDNSLAKSGVLKGLHSSLLDSAVAGLDFNLSVLEKEGLCSDKQVMSIRQLFSSENPLLQVKKAVLVHNDFADWNSLTDGKVITGMLDWDECVASDPIADVACWSTFFNPERMEGFLAGYWQVASKTEDFQEKFELWRLRYVLSKMTLRVRRYTWERTDAIRERMESGKVHLAESMKYFGV